MANLLYILVAPVAISVGVTLARRESLFLTCYAGTVFFHAVIILLALFAYLFEKPPLDNSMALLRTSYAGMLVFSTFALGESYAKGLPFGFKVVSLGAILAWLAVPLHIAIAAGLPDH